jgi:hypothetical protein
MRRFLYTLAIAMTLPHIIWQPRPARAATMEAPVVATAPIAQPR